MTKKLNHIIILLALIGVHFSSNSQGERDYWYFGQGAGIKFDNGTLETLNDNNIPRNIFLGIIEGPDNIICVSDEDGQLLFYSDGRVYKNKFHENLTNSPTDEYAVKESQAAVARDPGNIDRYYVFITIDDQLTSRLTYTIVDMSLNNGNGGLVPNKTHVLMANNNSQHMVVARHANGRDSWLITIRQGRYESYLISENGISTTPVTSLSGFSFVNGATLKFGNLEISPDNELLVAGFPFFKNEPILVNGEIVEQGLANKIILSKFNDLTGKISFLYEDDSENTDPTISPRFTAVEFSSNSKVLYSTYVNERLQQYDLSDIDNIPPPIEIETSNQFPYLKRGPDGRIYSIARGDTFIGAINSPNTIGVNCDYNGNVFNISGENLMDLPVFLQPKYPEGISFINICNGENTEIAFVGSFREDVIISWDLGDGNTATGSNINHLYELPGTYTVTASVINTETTNIIFTDSEEITIYDSPNINIPDNIYLCSEDTNIFFSDFNNEIVNNVNIDAFNISYHFSENDALLNNNEVNEYVPQIGSITIWVRIENKLSPSCYIIVNFNIFTPEFITIDIPEEQFICDLKSGLTITAPDGFTNYTWSNGINNQSNTIFFPGTYNLTVEKDFGDFICTAQTQIKVLTGDELPVIEDINVLDWSQNHNSIEVIIDRIGNYEYSIDGINYQESPIFLNLAIDDYYVYVRDARCLQQIKSEKLFLLYHDKFFTPNGDGVNDYWRVINNFREEDIEIQIFDRFGKLLETMSYFDRGWDGTSNGVEMPTSDYWYRVVRQSGKVHLGHFTLKR